MPLESGVNKRDINVLFTSAGRRVELLRAFRRAYDALGLRGKILATDVQSLAPTLQIADVACIVPRHNDPAFLPTLVDIIRREAVSLVFPLIDPDIPFLAMNREALEAAGARVMTPSAGGAEAAADKWKTNQLFTALNIPAARSWLPENLPTENLEFPLFIKPRRGSAGQGAFRIENKSQLDFFLTFVEDPIVQECLPGPEITSDVFCGAQGDVWAVVSRKRIEIRAGEVSKGVTVWDEEIAHWCIEAAKGLQAVGPITVQCILRDGKPYFTEINARFGGGCPLGFAAGAVAPDWYLAEAAGLPPVIPRLGTYRVGLCLTRFDDSFFVDEKKAKR